MKKKEFYEQLREYKINKGYKDLAWPKTPPRVSVELYEASTTNIKTSA